MMMMIQYDEAIPYVDRISYRVDMRERAMAIAPQAAITKDNVSVDVSGNLYIQVSSSGSSS